MENITKTEGEQIVFAKDKTPIQKAGAFIREARQGRNISIEELATKLRIGKEQLTALENGDEDLLPEKVFIKAMIRRIAEKLQIDASFILEELNGREVKGAMIYQEKKKRKGKRKVNPLNFNLMPLVLILSGLLGIGASVFVVNQLDTNKESFVIFK